MRLRYFNFFLDDLIVLEGCFIIYVFFVRGDLGMGMVYCVLGYGFDDYLVCEVLGILVVLYVDNEGCFIDKVYFRNFDLFGGIFVLEGGSDVVLDLFGNENGYIFKVKYYKYKYLYDWWMKKFIIICVIV